MRTQACAIAGLVLLACSAVARAELYRWVDPESGSIKIASYPPPWYGEGAKTQRGPPVEVIRSPFSAPEKQAAPPPARMPAEAPAAKRADTQPLAAGAAQAAGGGGLLEKLEAKRKELMKFFDAFPKATDFNTASAGFGQQLQAYDAVIAEMDRLDPKRAAARQAEDNSLMAKFREGMRFQFSPTPDLTGKPKK